MRGDNQSVNIKNKTTGEMKRIKRLLAEELVSGGAWVFIPNSEFRAKKRAAAKARAEAAAKKAEETAAKVPQKAKTRQSKNKGKGKKR